MLLTSLEPYLLFSLLGLYMRQVVAAKGADDVQLLAPISLDEYYRLTDTANFNATLIKEASLAFQKSLILPYGTKDMVAAVTIQNPTFLRGMVALKGLKDLINTTDCSAKDKGKICIRCKNE